VPAGVRATKPKLIDILIQDVWIKTLKSSYETVKALDRSLKLTMQHPSLGDGTQKSNIAMALVLNDAFGGNG
jgi:hypothetical protein